MGTNLTVTPWAMLVTAGVEPEDAVSVLKQLAGIGYRDVPSLAAVVARAHAAGRVSGMGLIQLRMATDVRGTAIAKPLDALKPGVSADDLRSALDEAEQLRLAEWGVIER